MYPLPMFALLFILYYLLLSKGKGPRCIVFRFAFIILDILLHLLNCWESNWGAFATSFSCQNVFYEYIYIYWRV